MPTIPDDAWIKYTLGGGVLIALGLAGKIVVERIARWIIDWFARVTAGLELLAEAKKGLDDLHDLVKGWDIHGLRNSVNVANLRSRVTEARVGRLDGDVRLIRVALDRHGIPVDPAPSLDMRLREGDRETVEILLRQLRDQGEGE